MREVSFRPARVCALLFVSGACALTYQVAWFRELRLIFGASTGASAAVLAVFMGGLGAGGLVLGKRADRAKNPLTLYANLEIAVAILAALTPAFVRIAERVYLLTGGSAALGNAGASIVRLLLSIIVLLPATFLMGGTLPAAAKAVERESDVARHRVAALYGINTFGAVAGSLAANFLLLEVFGTQLTQWVAALLNLLVGVVARALSRSMKSREPVDDVPAVAPPVRDRATWFPPAAAVIAGATFLLMELVWYRMLAPILGGSSYTFGLILAVALAGIAIGGLVYARVRAMPTFRLFALTCALEALFIALPYALGDRIAVLALLLRPLAKSGFGASVAVWAIVAAIVVLPTAIVSGFQFPVVIGLYGSGANRVGRDVGNAYLANTLGSIAGSIAGGFGLLPALSAPGCWRLVVLVLAASSAISLYVDARIRTERGSARSIAGLAPAVLGALALAALFARGPSPTWRHSGIGAGRADRYLTNVGPIALETLDRDSRESMEWEEDGRESSVALARLNGYTFIVNGKADGHVIGDAPTQVMSGLLGALLHEDPKRALVIGLGTGSTAGWLGKVPSIERVDVVELEPAILRVAKDCAPVNEDVLSNPRVAIRIADAREALLTTRETYDVVFSEPSNPYRAGIASLYTLEYYQAAVERMREGGLFIQWVQAYEVDGWAIATVATTLRKAFPFVSVWQTMRGDFLFIGKKSPLVVDVDRMRARLATEPYGSGARKVWRTSSPEGILAHYVGSAALTAFFADKGLGVVNRDDQNFLEFAFARSVGRRTLVDLVEMSRRLGADVPQTTGTIDPKAAVVERWLYQSREHLPLHPRPSDTAGLAATGIAIERLASGRWATGLDAWKKLGRAPIATQESSLVAFAAAITGDRAFEELGALVEDPTERDLLRGLFLSRGGASTFAQTVDAVERGLIGLRTDPWPRTEAANDVLLLAADLGARSPDAARRLYAATSEPFAVEIARRERLQANLRLGRTLGVAECVRALDRFRAFPWVRPILEARHSCTRAANRPDAAEAEADLLTFLAAEGSYADLVPSRPAPAPTLRASASAPAPGPGQGQVEDDAREDARDAGPDFHVDPPTNDAVNAR